MCNYYADDSEIVHVGEESTREIFDRLVATLNSIENLDYQAITKINYIGDHLLEVEVDGKEYGLFDYKKNKFIED